MPVYTLFPPNFTCAYKETKKKTKKNLYTPCQSSLMKYKILVCFSFSQFSNPKLTPSPTQIMNRHVSLIVSTEKYLRLEEQPGVALVPKYILTKLEFFLYVFVCKFFFFFCM